MELIEDKNTKILCKNIWYGHAEQWRGHATKVWRTMPKSGPWHGPCHHKHIHARLLCPFWCFVPECWHGPCLWWHGPCLWWHGPCLWWHGRAKIPAAFFSLFWPRSPWIFLCNTPMMYFLGLKSVLGYK